MNQTIGENAIDRRSRYAIAFAQVDVVDVGGQCTRPIHQAKAHC
ncbi:hypothetical protein [Moorena sp. SIO1G6]|nr:hypothetical protein [Moorena sp. SIO1G6]